jgi:hypothetical protein
MEFHLSDLLGISKKFIIKTIQWVEKNKINLLELGLIVAWVLFVGKGLLNFNPNYMPIGNEFQMSIQSLYAWDWLPRCGTCMLWYGQINGGAPAFAELHGAILHPFTVITTLLFGAVNGSKVVILLCLATAGIAQWWLAKVMRLGWIARLWSAGMVVVGGHIAGRLILGNIGLLVSLSCASLVLAPLYDLAINKNRKAVIPLAVCMALTWVGGQGYMQIGVMVAYLPAAAIHLLIAGKKNWKDLGISFGLSILLICTLLIPVLHFLPYFDKQADSTLSLYQPLEYSPLNLIIRDPAYFQTNILGKMDIPYVFVNFIGWAPIIMALLALFITRKKYIKEIIFFLSGITLIYLFTSLEFADFFSGFSSIYGSLRNFSLAQSMAVPLLVGLGAWGLNTLSEKDWPRIGLEQPYNRFSSKWIFLILFVLLSILPVYKFTQPYYQLFNLEPNLNEISYLHTDTAEWVFPVANSWIPSVLEDQGKISYTYRPWRWRNQADPQAYISLINNPENHAIENSVQRIGELNLVINPGNEYAVVETASGPANCDAVSRGGIIDVTCVAPADGNLIVLEHYYSGWTATVDGERVDMEYSPWLSVNLQPGEHHIRFVYRPWDVWVGLILTLVGIGLCIYLIKIHYFNKKA